MKELRILVALALCLAPAVITFAGAQSAGKGTARGTTLETVRVSLESGSGISIEITTKDETAPWVETLTDPARIVVDLPNTVLATGLGPIPVRTVGVKGIRIGTDAAKTTRVVVDLTRLCRYELVPGSGHQLILKLDPTSPPAALAAEAGVTAREGRITLEQKSQQQGAAPALKESPIRSHLSPHRHPQEQVPAMAERTRSATGQMPGQHQPPATAGVRASTEVAVTQPSSTAARGQVNAQPAPTTGSSAASASAASTAAPGAPSRNADTASQVSSGGVPAAGGTRAPSTVASVQPNIAQPVPASRVPVPNTSGAGGGAAPAVAQKSPQPVIPTSNATAPAQLSAITTSTQNASAAKVLRARSRLLIPRVFTPPRIEDFRVAAGRPDQIAVTDFRQREPGDGTPVSRPTTAYLSYDDENLYVIFVCKDDPAKLRARMTRRKDIDNDDKVVVYLDTFHDHRRAYVFAANPLGVQSDAIRTEGEDEDDVSFSTLWHSEGRLTQDGYTVLITLPFKSLRFRDTGSQEWGIALERVIFRNNEHSFWPYISNRYQAFVPQMATLAGLDKISGGHNIQLVPYGTFSHARYLDPTKPAFVSTEKGSGGIDGKFILRNAFALDLTANPDFSEVESDDPQVTINQRTEVSFPEKRPLFVENAGFFQTPLNLFYSRRIVAPRFGVRLTGKAGPWAVGILGADDRQAIISDPVVGSGPEPDESTPMKAAMGVVRVQRELGETSSIGFFASNRNLGQRWDNLSSAWNRVYSMDGRFRLGPNWVFAGQVAGSSQLQLNGKRLSGYAVDATLLYAGLHLNSITKFQDLNPNFRAELGYVPRVDIRQIEQTVSYLWRSEGHRLLGFGPTVSGATDWDHKGLLQDWFGTAEFEFDFTGSTQFKIGRNTAYEYYGNHGFYKYYNELSAYTEPLKWLGFSGTLDIGTGINYDPASQLSPFLADSAGSSIGITIRPSPQLRLDEIYIYDGLTSRANGPNMRRPSIYNNHLVRSKLNYQFTRALSLRAIVDYNGVLPNSGLTDLEREKQLTGNLLLTWMPHPGTGVYLGYTDSFENVTLDPLDPTGLRRTGAPTVPTDRQVFVKISYLFRF